MVLPDHGCFMSLYILPAATLSPINSLYFSEADREPCAFLCLYPSTFSVQADLFTVKVIVSMMNPSTLCDMSMPDHKLYGTLDIPYSPTGLGSCKFRAAEYEASENFYIPDKP